MVVPPPGDDDLDDDQAESEAPISERAASSGFDASYVNPADAARRVQFQIGNIIFLKT